MNKYIMPIKTLCLLLAGAAFVPKAALPQSAGPHLSSPSRLDSYNVSWNTPGPNSAASMPLGNGDIGLNVWVDPGGDLLFYISKTDAWGGEKDSAADSWMQQGGVLMKLGLVRVSLSPNLFAAGATGNAGATDNAGATATTGAAPGRFLQTLRLRQGEIDITEGEGTAAINYRIWVDANHPVIRVEATGTRPFRTTVTLHDWRLRQGDTIVPGQSSRITWFHRNPSMGEDRKSVV